MISRDRLPAVIVNPSTPIGPRDVRPTPTGRIIIEAASGRMPAFVETGLNFVHDPKTALFWSTNTGYIPVTKSGFDFMKSNGFYDKAPYKGREIAIVTARRFRHPETNLQTRSNSTARLLAGTSAK